jgi:hypothetical protein
MKPISYVAAVERIERAVEALRSEPMAGNVAVADLLELLAARWVPPKDVQHYPARAELQAARAELQAARAELQARAMALVDAILETKDRTVSP